MKTSRKEKARIIAIELINEISEKNMSYSEMIHIQNYLYELAKKNGLVMEFKENGII